MYLYPMQAFVSILIAIKSTRKYPVILLAAMFALTCPPFHYQDRRWSQNDNDFKFIQRSLFVDDSFTSN